MPHMQRFWKLGGARRQAQLADRARDAGRFEEALTGYEEALRRYPQRSALHVQAGHMAKELRRFDVAEEHYLQAERHRSRDADLQLQLGHFYKTIDQLEMAEARYRQALLLKPGWRDAQIEIARLDQRRGRGGPVEVRIDPKGLAPELFPGARARDLPGRLDEIVFRTLGNGHVESSVGRLPALSGVTALRGLCIVEEFVDRAEIFIDDVMFHTGPVDNFPLDHTGVTKAVFNIWVDLSAFRGVRRLELVLVDRTGRTRSRFEFVYVSEPLLEAQHPDSHGVVTLGSDHVDVDADIRGRPTVVCQAGTPTLKEPRSILVVRTDQLGDLVVSIPAIERLRSLYPAAQITALVTEANAGLARTLSIFDDIVVVDFPDDPHQRQRILDADAQEALRVLLAERQFDVAIDLATSGMSRPLLKLSGAPFTMGFDDEGFPWMTAGVAGGIHDPHGRSEVSSHASRVLALIERLATLTAPRAPTRRRLDFGREKLARQDLDPNERYIVIHAGARIEFSRWPSFGELAEKLAGQTDLRVIMLTEGGAAAAGFSTRAITVIGKRLPFDDFDALVSHCELFIGNDSGPKHLAALRGVPVLSIHSARIDWREWGQQQTGFIMTRRVPCAGCAIYHDEDECGKDPCCIKDIGVDEVLSVALRLLGHA